MKLAFLELCGFRGYRKPLRVDFADDFTIIDGRNGVGKSTLFDAIEFALTGALSKYNDAKASGETVADYLWWTGGGAGLSEWYVEVGFHDADTTVSVRRTQLREPEQSVLSEIMRRLCDTRLAPSEPLKQLCSASIIRDEHITSLSLDLKETDRYNLLREALGANDAERWIHRGGQLVALAKKRTASMQQEVVAANADVASAARQRDQARASLVTDAIIAEVVTRRREFANSSAAPEDLSGVVRERIAAVSAELDRLRSVTSRWAAIESDRSRLPALKSAAEAAGAAKEAATAALESLSRSEAPVSSSSMADDARAVVALIALGRKVGLQQGHCPLCAKAQSAEEYLQGMQDAERVARRLSEEAARAAELEQARADLGARLAAADREDEACRLAFSTTLERVDAFDSSLSALEGGPLASLKQVEARADALQRSLDSALGDLRILGTLHVNEALERAGQAEAEAVIRLSRAQERFGRARKAEGIAHALHDAARRAASETLDQRLERVLPLMSELYRRLRPHPVWNDIEYAIRGDVRRFMTLQVGEHLNPQFLFSSGQRRATGLAFLLSVNLSLAWSRWQTVLLDDPVQHVDDFRTVHLAEVMSHLVADGRQVICAVEDAALADLLCRRLPVSRPGGASRITLGLDGDGDLGVAAERRLAPLERSTLVEGEERLATG